MSDERLRIDLNALDNELLENPGLVHQIYDEYAEAVALRDTKKDTLKTIEAELDVRLREELAQNGKVTEKIVEAAVQVHPRRKEAFHQWNEASLAAAKCYAMVESVSTRSDAIKELSKLYIAGYFTINSTKRSAITQELQYNKSREQLASKRSQK